MLVSEQDALTRLGSPLNLMNRLGGMKRRDAMGLFGVNNKQPDSNTPSTESKPASSITSFNPFPKQAESTALIPRTQPAHHILPVSTEQPEPKQPGLDDLVNNADSQVKLGLAHDKALDTLVSAVDLIKMKLDDIKPDKLPSVIAATSKVVDQIQRQRIDANKNKTTQDVHFHFYTPTQKKMEDYDVIEVG